MFIWIKFVEYFKLATAAVAPSDRRSSEACSRLFFSVPSRSVTKNRQYRNSESKLLASIDYTSYLSEINHVQDHEAYAWLQLCSLGNEMLKLLEDAVNGALVVRDVEAFANH